MGTLKIYRISIVLSTLCFLLLILHACGSKEARLAPVSYAQFEVFVNETGYVTDAQKYGWSIVQINVYDFKKVNHATWQKPDGVHAPASKKLPVTQVSYNDAVAYCQWAGKRLPTYNEYWKMIKDDNRPVVSQNMAPISAVAEVNVLGNVWDITDTQKEGSIRLAGGSVFCSQTTCHGTVKERELYVDKETGNIHIGFCVVN